MTDLATLGIKIVTNGASRATTDLNNVGRVAQKTESAVEQLSTCLHRLQGLLALSGIGGGVNQLLQLADKMQSLRNQVQFVTGSMAELNQVQNELFNIAQNTRASLESTTQLYVKSAQALKDYGYAQKDILKFTETINKAMAVGGVGAQEQASALLQLSQALGSGQLQGDEFKTIAESAPIILDVLAEYMGKSRAEVKKMASDGELTAKLLFDAFNNSSKKITDKFNQMPISFGGAMQQMQNAFMKFVDEQNQAYGVTKNLAEAIGFLAQHFDVLAIAILAVLGGNLSKFIASIAMARIESYQQAQANLAVAKSTQLKASAELATAQAQMRALNASLALAQSERTRLTIRAQMAQQSALIVSLVNAEATATRNLATASNQASLAKSALAGATNLVKGAMGLLGGPAGVITIAAGALFYFCQKAQEAREAALDTAGANGRLKQSYDDLSATSLKDKLFKEIELLHSYQAEIEKLKASLAFKQKLFDDGDPFAPTREGLEKLKNDLDQAKATVGVSLQVIEKQVKNLALRLLEGGESMMQVKDDLMAMGVSADTVNQIFNTNEFQIASVKAQFEALFPQVDKTKISYDGVNVSIGNFSFAADLAMVKALNLEGGLSSLAKTALMVASAVMNMNGALGTGISDKAQKEIDRIKTQTKIRELEQLGNYKEAAKLKGQQRATDLGYKEGSTDYNAVAEANSADALAQYNIQSGKKLASSAKKHQSELKRQEKEVERQAKEAQRHQQEWANFYDELKRAGADSWERIGLEQDRTLREMNEKLKKANVSYEEIEQAKALITERYAKARQEIVEKYSPELRLQRELQDKLNDIERLESVGLLTGKQADKAVIQAKWDTGGQVAKQAGEDAVSDYDRWKADFDPMQAIKNEQTSKLAELQSYYDQGLIQYQDFVKAKAQIDAQATADTQNLFMSSISGFGSALDTMMGVMRSAGKEQSSIYRAMFALSKSFAIADSIIKIQQGIANAATQPYPMNLAAMATVAAETASIVSNIQAVSLGGMAHSGIDNIPKEGTWLLDKGERVVDSRTNQDLKRFLNNQSNVNGSAKQNIQVKIINQGQPIEAKVTQEQKGDQTLVTIELLKKMHGIAKEEANNAIINNFARAGGAFSR